MKKGTEFAQCLIGVCLFDAVRVFLLEIVGVFASVFDGEGGFPAKLIPRFVDIGEVLVDVARTVSLFGGGGHTRAAGCTVYAETEEKFSEAAGILKKDIAAQLEAALKG